MKFEERSDYSESLTWPEKVQHKGRYKIRAARFIKGIVTAPTLFAIEEFPELRPIIDREFGPRQDSSTTVPQGQTFEYVIFNPILLAYQRLIPILL
ncbi:hypothetical protein OROGR_018451 [Orobanche gracilis]